MTVGELSCRTGVPVKTLRAYTDLGLIYTRGRSPANYRLFDTDALWCVHFISELRGLGPSRSTKGKEPAVETDTQQFTDRFTDSLASAPGVRLEPLRPLLTLLATGEPVTVGRLADAAGRTTEQIREALAAMPDTEYDADGRIIGHGLTFNPTPHRYETSGRTLFTWCALDTLIFPAILDHTAKVTSPCHATGQPVRLIATPGGPTQVEPATAVVSLITPDAPTSIRTSFCNQIHFFTSTDAAKDWLAEHPNARVLPVTDAFAVERPVIEQELPTTRGTRVPERESRKASFSSAGWRGRPRLSHRLRGGRAAAKTRRAGPGV